MRNSSSVPPPRTHLETPLASHERSASSHQASGDRASASSLSHDKPITWKDPRIINLEQNVNSIVRNLGSLEKIYVFLSRGQGSSQDPTVARCTSSHSCSPSVVRDVRLDELEHTSDDMYEGFDREEGSPPPDDADSLLEEQAVVGDDWYYPHDT